MADAVPVCDVLCEAMEYLSKLGSNLKVRSENLREKKIRRDRLKNTHAVQKAAKKVLLICELSKKSLDNVETGVKNLLSQIDVSQASTSPGGKSRHSNKSVSYEYFEYASKRLRIKEKICLKHYTSVKVLAKPLPPGMLNKYPVYLDCKLYRLQKENENLEETIEKDQSIENNFDNSFCQPKKINSTENSQNDEKDSSTPESSRNDEKDINSTENNKSHEKDINPTKNSNNDGDIDSTKNSKTDEKDINSTKNSKNDEKEINSTENNKNDEKNVNSTENSKNDEENVNSTENSKNDEKDINSTENSKNDDVENNLSTLLCNDNNTICEEFIESIADNNETTESDGILAKENDKNTKSINSRKKSDCGNKNEDKDLNLDKPTDDSPETSKEGKTKDFPESNAPKNSQNSPRSLSRDGESNRGTNNEINSENSQDKKDDNRNINKDETTSETIENIKSFIKCVNINKLLMTPNKEEDDDDLTNIKDLTTTKSMKKPQEPATVNKKVKRKKFKRISRLKSSSDDSSLELESELEQKRKEVKLFKPKDFVITVRRLPDFTVNFLKTEGLKKITHNGLTLCDIKSGLDNTKELQIADKCSKDVSCSSQKTGDKNLEKADKLSEIEITKENLMNDSDSDKSLNRKTDKDLLDVAESVRNALLDGSEFDRQSEFENIASSVETTGNDKETLNDKQTTSNADIETNTCNDDTSIENSEQNKEATLSNASNDNNDKTAQNEITDTTKEKDSQCDNEAEDDIPLSLQSSQDPEKVKSSLLNDSSDNSVSSPNKTKSKEDENKSNNEDPEKVKSQLLNDLSDNNEEEPLKQSQGSEKEAPRRNKRKHIMESMYAKKMLLTYSSSSDTDDEQLTNVLKEIKESLLEEIISDKGKQCIKIRPNKNSDSDSDKIVAEVVKKRSTKRKATSPPGKGLKLTLRIKKRTKSKANDSESEDDKHSNSGSSQMGRTRAKRGSSSRRNSDSQDPNDKDIDGLTNLRSLNKLRHRRDSSTNRTADTCDSHPSREEMPKVPRIKAEALLKAETSSDAASIAGSDEGEEAEELPTVSMATINGDGISHLAKDDLLGDSDSSTSQNDKSQEESKKSESEEDTVKSKRRGKAAAISSDSEAGSSRKPGRGKRLSDFEDSEDDGSSEPAVKKRRKKKESDSDGDGSDTGSSKKRRRRIKNVDDSDASDSDTENEGRNKHGRKNIRKVMGKSQLEEATKKAAREEKERIARIAERQKMYNNLEFDESGKPDEVILEKVVLDFDPETKEPLIEVDRGLVKKLKPHQANGIKFMWDACFESVKRIKKDKGSGCILAHCMGLGKTLQVVSLTHTLLTHGDLTSVNRVLVVCPLSTVLNWVNEFRIWLKHAERDYEVDVYELSRFKQNSERAFQLQQWFIHGGVCVLGYEMFRNLSADNPKKFKKKMLKNFQESLVDPGPDLVVCDEGHLLKNEKTSLSQSMNRVKTLRRIVLTGTPLQNNLKEYYCMVQFVKPNLLGKYNEYLNRFVNPITNGQYTDSTEHDIKVMKRRSHVLHKMLDGAVQRRDYGVLAPFLPPKHEYVLFITLTEVQIKLYQHYLDNYSRRPLPGKSSGFLFPDFQSLQRIWTHPLVLKYNSERYEIMQQKKREREEEDSEGSLVDFIDDDSTPDESSTEESSDDGSDVSDDSRKKSKKKKAAKKGKAKDSKVSTRRGTRANPVEQLEEEEKPLESLESKYENPTEWWIKLMNEDELEDLRNSHKLVLLFDILRQCEAIGDKLLVFSQSLYSLDLIEHFLGKVDEATQEGRIDEKLGGHVGSWSPGIDYFRLDGSTSCENRSIWCKNFNREDNPRARLFLISTRAGGLGINLVAANRVVIFDVSWNPSHDVQSIFRVYRFGQKKPCYIYRFLAMGTMEEKIYERQVTKQAISKRVIDEQQIDRHYAENDLAELYKFEPRPPTPRPLPALPKDRLFAEMLREHDAQIYKYHEHDSLLENKEEETLSEEERKAAWEDFENEKNRPPPQPFPNAWQMPNGMVPGLLQQQQQQLAYATLGAMLRKDIPNINDSQIREMLPLIYNSSMFGGYDYGMMQKMSDMYKYPQAGMMNNAAMNSFMNAGGGAAANMGGSSGLQYEPPWQRQQQQQQQMRLQQMMQQQQHQNLGAKFYAGGLGSRDPVAMAIQQQRTREMMLGERPGARPRGRPPLQRNPPPSDVVNLADSD